MKVFQIIYETLEMDYDIGWSGWVEQIPDKILYTNDEKKAKMYAFKRNLEYSDRRYFHKEINLVEI